MGCLYGEYCGQYGHVYAMGLRAAPIVEKNQRWRRIVPMALGITLFIEASQLFIGRSVDVDDLLLNFAGGCIGAAVYFVLCRWCPKIRDYAEG